MKHVAKIFHHLKKKFAAKLVIETLTRKKIPTKIFSSLFSLNIQLILNMQSILKTNNTCQGYSPALAFVPPMIRRVAVLKPGRVPHVSAAI